VVEDFVMVGRLSIIGIGFILALGAVHLASPAHASVIYDYVGQPFTARADAPLTSADFLTGFVEFATAPTSGETGKSDVIDFSFSGGPFTLDSTAAAGFPTQVFSFDFDSSSPTPAIVAWGLAVADTGLLPRVRSCGGLAVSGWCGAGDTFDEIGTATGIYGFNADGHPGVWEVRPVSEVSKVPLPLAMPLFATGLGALGLAGWWRRRRAAV
jgi:hypothetical protein